MGHMIDNARNQEAIDNLRNNSAGAQARKAASTIGTIGSVASGILLGDTMNVLGAVGEYKSASEHGDNPFFAASKAGFSFVSSEVIYGALTGMPGMIAGMGITMGLSMGMSLTEKMWKHTGETMSKASSNFGRMGSGSFNMQEAGYTMRQRSLNAIKANGYNTRAVLGNEARNYFLGN